MRKAEVGTEIIMWIAIVTIVVMVSTWYISNLRPLKGQAETAEFDMEQIRKAMNNACHSDNYSKNYNPRTEVGKINLTDGEVCIKSGDVYLCENFYCSTDTIEDNENISLEDITYMKFRKENTTIMIK
jgi:hypothetical protein